MLGPAYMKISQRYIPTDIIQRNNLNPKFHNDYIYYKIKKGMCGLKQAALLAYIILVKNLRPYGYFPTSHTEGIWKHKTKPIIFCLTVYDFGVKCFHKKMLYISLMHFNNITNYPQIETETFFVVFK